MGLDITGLGRPWVLLVVLLAVTYLLPWWARRTATAARGQTLPLAHSETLRELPRFRQLIRRQRRLSALVVLGSLLVVAGAGVAVAGPRAEETDVPDRRARDLMLCLDVSTATDATNVTLVRAIRRLLGQLDDDRIGLTIWSSAAVVVFPLTDDYDFVRSELNRAEAAFIGHDENYLAGVDVADLGASLIGDGIASCAKGLGRPDRSRSRVVLVTSDNDPQGTPAFSLPAAAAFASRRQVLVYGVGAASLDQPDRTQARREFASAAIGTGGVFVVLRDETGARVLGDRLRSLARLQSAEPPRIVSHDVSYLGAVPAGVGLALIVGVALVRRRQAPE